MQPELMLEGIGPTFIVPVENPGPKGGYEPRLMDSSPVVHRLQGTITKTIHAFDLKQSDNKRYLGSVLATRI